MERENASIRRDNGAGGCEKENAIERGTLTAERDQLQAAIQAKAQQLMLFQQRAAECERQLLQAEGALAMLDKLLRPAEEKPAPEDAEIA